MYGLVAEDAEGRLLGLMNWCFIRPRSAVGYCYIEDLYVSPQARGRKVSEKLFEQAYRLAETRGSDRVYWMTRVQRAGALAVRQNRQKKLVYRLFPLIAGGRLWQ